MTILSAARRPLLGLLLMTIALPRPAATAQSATGVSPNWRDLELWTRTISATREVEHALGLQLAGSSGTILLSFAGRIDPRGPAPQPRQIDVVVAPALFSNPNAVRPVTLRLTADQGTPLAFSVDLTSNLRSDDPAPGAVVRSAVASMRAADFDRLADAKVLEGSSFGSDFVFRADQIRAMRDLADRLKL